MAEAPGVSERLRQALKHREKKLSWLHEQVESSGVRGSSYGSVYAYVKGEAKTEPPLEFLREAAAALDVRFPWLATGQGAMTEDEARVGDHAAAADETRDRQRYDAWRLKLNVLHAMGVLPETIRLEAMPGRIESHDDFLGFAQRANVSHLPAWVPALAEVRARYGRDTIDPAALGQALRGPLEAIGIDPVAGADRTYRTEEWLDDYIAGMVPVLLALAPEVQKQRENADTEEETDG